jgi:hypothetical protein
MKIKLNIRNKWQNTLQLFQGEEREKRGKKKVYQSQTIPPM